MKNVWKIQNNQRIEGGLTYEQKKLDLKGQNGEVSLMNAMSFFLKNLLLANKEIA
ncbi:hypothetical protein [Cedecea sp. P7760]|uniref:hypothetical protein n=1 Tax=Cedecea sp. P7760 TaxID=2726983 RepID=UPI0015A0DD6D|nr:hypothetical protein [Cedecea sp. P7760]NWC65500.1 hypothetical protein [Cedecea sp. P7760]